MRTTSAFIVVALGGLLTGCLAPVKHTIVYGESFATTDEAVLEARNAMGNAARLAGCKPISIGSGGAGGAPKQENAGGLLLNVVVLLECPAGAPEILAATGLPVTP